jgi:hypothetical protein
VFGELMEGESVLSSIERTPVDSKDKPMIDIVIIQTHVVSEPFKAADDSELSDDASKLLTYWKASGSDSKSSAPSVGKYLMNKRK